MYEDSTTDTVEQSTTDSVRQEFAELIGDHEEPAWCITSEEAEHLLTLGDAATLHKAFQNCANWLLRESKKDHRFMEDEVLAFIETEIPKVLASSIEKANLSIADLTRKQEMVRIKASHKAGRMPKVEIIVNLIQACKDRVGLEISEEEASDLLSCGASIPVLLQSINRVRSAQKHSGLSRSQTFETLARFIADEKARDAARKTKANA